jgi:hypothetical protein
VKCQRRALTSGLRQAEEAIVRTAEAHRWTKAALDCALDDVRGRALPQREEADHFLQAEEQEKRSKWMSECQRMAQNAINLASQATRALTISDWSYQDCEEFLDDLEREFKKVNKALDTHSPMDCEPGVKRMADCRLRLEAARFEAEMAVTRLLRDHEAWGQVSREGRPKEKAPDTRMEPRGRGEADNPVTGAQLVRFGSLRSERNDAGAGEPEEDRPRSSRSTREGRYATSTPTCSDREQRLKEGLEEVSGIRGAHLPTPPPRREVSPGRSRELVNLFRENCLDKKVADRLRCEETMAGCWRVLDPFYSRPTQYAQDLMSEITATKRIQHSE